MDTTTWAATTLTIPTPVRAVVGRPHLIEQLDHHCYRVGVASAPAGFGKTALLATWAADHRESTAWLSCNVTDPEPTRFWRGLLATVAARWPGVGDDATVLLERDGAASPELAISLANDLGQDDTPKLIVIDDLHLAAPTPPVFAGLVAAMPATVRLVIGSRVDPPLPLGRLRVGGSLLELHSDDLCFSLTETADVLRINEVMLEPQQLSRLHDLTEGWPAGVQLAALALQRATDQTGFLDAFSSTDRAVADFLVAEVLDRQPPELVEFLYTTSVLEQFDAALCEAVTGRDDAAGLLDQLVAANLFVVRVDVGGGWYRYHHLFGAFLQARLRTLGQSRWRAAHQRARQALEARGDVVAALHHATAIGDVEEGAAIVRRTLGRWFNAGDLDTTSAVARQWLRRYGRERIATDPAQVLEVLMPLVATSDFDDAVWWFTQIEAAHPDASPVLNAQLQGTWAEHHLCHGQADEALRHAQTAMDAVGGTPPPDSFLPALPIGLARAHLQADDPAGAVAVLDAVEARRTGHPVVDDVRVPALQAWVAFLDGGLRRAAQRANAAIMCADELELPPSEPGRIFGGLALAGLHLEHNDDDTVSQLFDQLRHDVDVSGRPPLQSLVALQHAEFARVIGDEATARTDLALARLMLPDASRSVDTMFDVEAVRQAIQFRPSTAADLIDALDDSPTANVLRIRLALVDGDHRAAADLLHHLSPATTLRERVVHGTIAALTLHDRDPAAADAHLGDALLAARPERFRRSILGQGPETLKLLLSFTPTDTIEGYVAELIDAASSAAAPLRTARVTALVEPLSGREVTVLRYLCSRLTYQEIASTLYVSHNTLKSHVSNVYRKLGVGSRRDAVEAGRRLRII